MSTSITFSSFNWSYWNINKLKAQGQKFNVNILLNLGIENAYVTIPNDDSKLGHSLLIDRACDNICSFVCQLAGLEEAILKKVT